MVAVKFAKESQEFKMFADYWNMCQKYWNIKDTDDKEWEQLVYDMQVFCETYTEISLARKLASALLDDLEKRCKDEV